MKRLLFFSIPLSIMACSILPIVNGANKQDNTSATPSDTKEEESQPLIVPQQVIAHIERPKARKIAAYYKPCSSIKIDNLKTEILAKLECLEAELNK